MRKILIVISFFVFSLTAEGQQIAQYTQYLFNHFQINPAVVGSKPCVDLKLGYRRQWWGFEGQPKTAFANIQARLPSKRGSTFRGWHGIGAMVESDDTGPTSRTMLNLAYAYHIPVNATTRFSLGLFAGIQQYRVDANKITLSRYDDPAINGSGSALLVPDISPGLWFYNQKFYAGLSIRQLLRNKIGSLGGESRLVHHYALVAGRKFSNDNGISIIPSALLKYAPLSMPALDLNLMLDFYNQFSVGLSYRNIDAVAAYFKVNFLSYFSLGYSFDFTTSQIRYDSSNTHEIMIGISACPSNGESQVSCPAYQ